MKRTMGVQRQVSRLEEHPNVSEVLGVLAQLAHIGDADLPRLADAWRNPLTVAEARSRALTPDSPLVCEVLSAFDAVSSLFADDLRGDAPYVTVDPQVTVRALKAVRDAIAAAYARPVLPRGQYAALIRPWRAVYPADVVGEPDLGPQGEQVKQLLAALPRLSVRCHDPRGAQLHADLVDRSFVAESERLEARESAFGAAVLTSRRRTWTLVRRSGAEGLSRACLTCRSSAPAGHEEQRDAQRVMGLCLDAACALLVADAVPEQVLQTLTEPVTALVPLQRRPGPSS